MTQTIIYPDGRTYNGAAVEETMYFEWLKWYSLEESKTKLLQAIIQGAADKGLVLLRTDIQYEEGTMYHKFNAKTSYIPPSSSSGQVSSMIIWTPVLIQAVVTAIAYIIGLILVYYILRQIKEIIYSPGGASNTLLYAVVLFGAAYLIIAVTGLLNTKVAKKKLT